MSITQIKRLAEDLLKQHGLTDWKVVFIDAKTKFGHCNYAKKEIAIEREHAKTHTKRIVAGTILHEIAHALVGLNAKSHGLEWQCQARQLGLRDMWETNRRVNALNRRRNRKTL